MKKRIAILPGDGIGPEVMQGAVRVLQAISDCFQHDFIFEQGLIGGAAIDECGNPLPDTTLDLCSKSDAILLGAVGGPKWDSTTHTIRPEQGLLRIRKELGLFANLRPVNAYQPLIHASTLKKEVIEHVDLLIVRELTGGLYFGKPSERRGVNKDLAIDTLVYNVKEIERVVDKAFQLARKRRKKLTSVDKANVLESSRMWREVVNRVSANYPDVQVEHMLVDSASMQLIYRPEQFDVIVTENLFGDILSDEASMITGSLGMLPSASLRSDMVGLYEPVHGSAPDIAGKNLANPLGMILSVALMLKFSFGLEKEANIIEESVMKVLTDGFHTGDLNVQQGTQVSTTEMVNKIIDSINENQAISGILTAYI
ncbi:3-isopropylmalate dehydrogenase [Heyndrickxia sporothermodurans]|uniref:3-isopropylmalate dehydrogenase n=1 Tax=Heyndrickxia sporothermodurans TaxID=46224 RepID=A0AB37HLG0_9BACI|nr:3-isopropylmalate dehydrogenase [Heyndrickxia sporothermodurans]MBL5766203.1 3-isopropylmalate dehydrogenase [Heyndrickxia sporothermodurans]MBL5769643.1 3-isopropylmalate dehydrogenase [Heyndrickxia sporothermodurans]MBL5774832.1 3-isopropylmalate dehydrogenase [Heyndrickxia sporothermodurans]MBL5776854.1 3-isopropylmalate dehydrogenase [Heyndrickxia sporothermodurans]MBL5780401.1 3-isopropylmalate dehydrogenase [Heyndrickxia sporothermodurans]